MDRLKNDMTDNMANLLERDQKLDTMLLKTDEMSNLSYSMSSKSRQVKDKLWWQGMTFKLIGVSIIVVSLNILKILLGHHLRNPCEHIWS